MLISAGGPLQTILTGLLGWVVLEIRRHRRKRSGLPPAWVANSPADWLWVFVAFFLSRQVLNFLSSLVGATWRHAHPVKLVGDEYQLARMWGLPYRSIVITTAAFAGMALLAVLLRHIPKAERGAFWLAGVVGGAAGVALWFGWPGPALMP